MSPKRYHVGPENTTDLGNSRFPTIDFSGYPLTLALTSSVVHSTDDNRPHDAIKSDPAEAAKADVEIVGDRRGNQEIWP